MDINFAKAKIPAGESKVRRISKIGKKIDSLPILKYLLYVGIFLIPIWLLPLTADVIELNKFVLISAVAGIGLLLWLISLVGGTSFKTQSKKVAIGVLVFALAIAASTLFGLNKDTGVFGLPGGYSSSLIGMFAAMSLFFLIVGTGVVKKKILRNLIIISTFIALLYGTLQVWGIHLLPLDISKTNSFNTVGTLNSLVILGAIVFPLLFAAPTSKKMKFIQVGAGV